VRVLHLPTLVGGMAWGLAQGEGRLGIDSKVLTTQEHFLNYPYDISLRWEKKGAISRVLSSLRAFLKYRNEFDVFHFNYGSTLIDFRTYGIHHWDLPYYPNEKKIIFTYNGCDARQKYKTIQRIRIAPCFEDDCYSGICNSGAMDKMREKRIGIVSKYAHHIFAVNPDLLYFLPETISSFLPYSIASWQEIQNVPYKINRKIKVVHSPTNRSAKGSKYIIQALENLKKRYSLEIVLVEKVSNREALEIYKQADLVVDQVLAGWYGGLAVEAMKTGRPVAVFIREDDLKFIPEKMAIDLRSAVINLNPLNIERVIEEHLQSPQLLYQKSEAGLEYVHKWHDPIYVAGITKSFYEG
jgi:hypothetical protein